MDEIGQKMVLEIVKIPIFIQFKSILFKIGWKLVEKIVKNWN